MSQYKLTPLVSYLEYRPARKTHCSNSTEGSLRVEECPICLDALQLQAGWAGRIDYMPCAPLGLLQPRKAQGRLARISTRREELHLRTEPQPLGCR